MVMSDKEHKKKRTKVTTYTIFEKLENGEPKFPDCDSLRGGSCRNKEMRPAPRPAARGPPPVR